MLGGVSVQENKDALVRVPTEEEERSRAIHPQREQLVTVRKVLETQGRSLMVNHGIEPVQQWWKRRAFAALSVQQWIKKLLGNSQPIVPPKSGRRGDRFPEVSSRQCP